MKALVTGGAGFIGANLCHHLLDKGHEVRILDNLSRTGVEKNVDWLRGMHGEAFELVVADVRDYAAVEKSVVARDAVFHLAGQVAVTTSLDDPRTDFEINVMGAFNVLEGARSARSNPAIIYASTNKVYGDLADVEVEPGPNGYRYVHLAEGVSEDRSINFRSPYGCSKGAADQYVLDYAHSYGLRTASVRQSCIYGTRQFGNVDQGWVAHMMISALVEKSLVIYGDGRQVRDILYIDDLLRLYDLLVEHIDRVQGQAFNVGGGARNVLSILGLIEFLERRLGRPISYSFSDWRVGDQRVYVSDVSKARRELGWSPQISADEGLNLLLSWAAANQELFGY